MAYIVISPEDLTTSQGHTLLLPCVVAAHDPNNVQVTWRQNGHSVDPVATPHLEVHTLMVSERGGVMFVKSVLEVCVTGQEARGNYTCTATNGQDVLDQQVFHISVDPRELWAFQGCQVEFHPESSGHTEIWSFTVRLTAVQ